MRLIDREASLDEISRQSRMITASFVFWKIDGPAKLAAAEHLN
jgi:hypothetical protein